jgi:outer membrane protein
MFMRKTTVLLTACTGLLRLDAALAEDDCKQSSSDCVAVGGWNFSVALGAGVRTNPLAHSKAIPLVVVPEFSYYGKRVFIENLDLGVTLAESATNTLNLVASPGYDRVFFYRTDLQNFFIGGLGQAGFNASKPGKPLLTENNAGGTQVQVLNRPRRITYLAGPEWTFKYLGVSGQFDFLHEITGQNSGNEIRAALGIPLVEAKGSLRANVGITWKSAATVDYYYGVPRVYRAGAAFNPFMKLGYSHPLSGKWTFTAFAHCERLGDAIADSPLIAHRFVTTVFAGTTYAF